MDRIDILTQGLSKNQRIIELGPSHNPIAPKAGGWRTTIVDHADRDYLIQHYAGEITSNIEDVDLVWKDGLLEESFDKSQLGTYDVILSSHSLEHIPDALGLLRSLERLLKPSGIVKLALPDKRCCFDFFLRCQLRGICYRHFHDEIRFIPSAPRSMRSHTLFAVTGNSVGCWPAIAAALSNSYTVSTSHTQSTKGPRKTMKENTMTFTLGASRQVASL